MQEYKPSAYVKWIKHLADYDRNSNIINRTPEETLIKVHPSHKTLSIPNSKRLYEEIDQNDKTSQLYFYSLAWIIPIAEFDTETNIALALQIVDDVLSIPSEDERSGAWNMLWDDHAVCERLCIIIEIVSNTSKFRNINVEKFSRHIEITHQRIKEFTQSAKWHNNNHRLFHLFSSYIYHHYKKNLSQQKIIAETISDFCKELIDTETGFAREQSISYCFFDIAIIERIIGSLNEISAPIEFDLEKIKKNLMEHINAIAFPDDTLPACGDTPVGLKLTNFQKRFSIPEKYRHQYWSRLERIGYYRGESKFKSTQYLMLQHNAESAHGHSSPLHLDVWMKNFGHIFIDSGGPYKYGDSLRYDWFITAKGHNSLDFSGSSNSYQNTFIQTNLSKDIAMGCARYLTAMHYREVISREQELLLKEIIYNEEPWSIHYNLAPAIDICTITDGHYILENKDFKKVEIYFNADDLKFKIGKTMRCTGHSLSVEANSIIVTGSPGIVSCAISIKIID